MTCKQLSKIITEHEKWLADKGGKRADLRRADLGLADLSGANLSGADLGLADLSGADLRNANLSGANLCGADLRRADLGLADLSGANLGRAELMRADLGLANLSGANLSDANLDYSCLPLWCGSLTAHFDDRQLHQIAYHLVHAGLNSRNASEETKAELRKLIPFANQFHRVNECGEIKEE